MSATVANSQTYNYNMIDLRNLGIAAIAVATFGMPCSARKNTKQPTPATSVQAKAKITKGLFDVSQSGNDWSFSIPDSLLNREFLVTVRFTSTPGGTDKYGGELANQQTVYFQKVGTDKLLLRSRLLINTADSVDKINRAVVISNSDPIIATLKIDGQSNGKITAKVPNAVLSGEGCGISKTTRMLAQKQPPLKECVIAHWSRDSAPKMTGAKVRNRSFGN